MAGMPSTPTLLRLPSAPPRLTYTEQVAAEIRVESARQWIRRSDLRELMGLTYYRMTLIWDGRRITMEDVARISRILEVDLHALLPAQ